MIVERYVNNYKETAFKIQSSEIEAVRKKDITKKAVRVYKDNCIGVSGAVGDVDDEVLKEAALEHLKAGIEYPYGATANIASNCTITNNKYTEENINDLAEELTTYLKSKTNMRFSEGFNLVEREVTLSNTENLDLKYKDSHLEIGLVLKDVNKANLFDGFLEYFGREFDIERFKAYANEICDKSVIDVELPNIDRMPVMVMSRDFIMSKFNRELNGEIYGIGGSLLCGKLGETVFNKKLNVILDRNPLNNFEPFFDFEGSMLENNKYDLIKDGKFMAVYNSKKVSDKFNQQYIGSASGDYDSVPVLATAPLCVMKDSENLKDVIKSKGGYLIITLLASGGDFTSSGEYASPVQLSYLSDGEKLIGKLPDFNIRGKFFSMFGEDYIGTFDSPLYMGDREYCTVMMMDIDR